MNGIELTMSDSESFIYSQAIDLILTVTDNNIKCRNEYSDTLSTSFKAVFNIIDGK